MRLHKSPTRPAKVLATKLADPAQGLGGDTVSLFCGLTVRDVMARVANVAALLALPVSVLTPGRSVLVWMCGYYAEGDGGGGEVYWSSASVAAHNGGSVFKPAAVGVGAGRWLRPWNGQWHAAQWGAKADNGVTDNTPMLTAAEDDIVSRGMGRLQLGAGFYGVRDLEHKAGVNLEGMGKNETYLVFKPSGNDAADATSYVLRWIGSGSSIRNFTISGISQSQRRICNGLLLQSDAGGQARDLRSIRIQNLAGYKAGAIGGPYGTRKEYARADITDDNGNHLLIGGNALVTLSAGNALWDLRVNGLDVSVCDGNGTDWTSLTDSKIHDVHVGNCVNHGWIESGANVHRSGIKVYLCRRLNVRDDYTTSLDLVVPHQATIGTDDGAVLLSGRRLYGDMEIQENGSNGVRLGTLTKTLSDSDIKFVLDGNGGYDSGASAPTQSNYRRVGGILYNTHNLKLSGVADDFRAEIGLGRQLRGISVLSAAFRPTVTNAANIVLGNWYRIKANAGGANFIPAQVGIAAPSNAVGTVFQARRQHPSAVLDPATTCGTGGVLEAANDGLNIDMVIANQYEQDQGTGPGYILDSVAGDWGGCINGKLVGRNLSLSPVASADTAISLTVQGEANPRWTLAGSKIGAGPGTSAIDVTFDRLAAGVIGAPATFGMRTGKATTVARPSAVAYGEGVAFYDLTLKLPIWSDGAVWRDADGSAV
ncbi:hypothetical protein C3942_16900 [Solimonas fluminis]|uniref:Pectate lyase superfamily protein domain-containing protein n=1 Tax=Solimonas fluminis TaxID=2086571 RepID=A0A2S5TCX7_9GAMM|nr:hypothetical protein [Solimonas fluminis]PPE72727.1 hypothetical protein C3942_16900 [Solimonas fluminis]